MRSIAKAYPALVVLLLAIASSVRSHSRYRLAIPNGGRVPDPCKPGGGAIWRGVGHQSPAGANARNPFGVDFVGAGYAWTAELCRKDSDGDGLTNGQELGDPDCVWTSGAAPARSTGLSHPGICPFDSPNCTNSWTVCPQTFDCRTMNETNVAVRNLTIKLNTSVPAKEVALICRAFELIGTGTPVHMIGSRPIIVNPDVLRRMTLYACHERPDQSLFDGPKECYWSVKSCIELIVLWDRGQELECVNGNAGYLVGGSAGIRFAVLQVQWTNSGRWSDFNDSSGFSLFFTPHLRAYHMGTQLFGELNLVLPPRKRAASVNHSCPSVCTSFYHAETRHITVAGLRMHSYGVRGRVSQWRNGTFVRDLYPMQAYDANSSLIQKFQQPVEFLMGDEVRTECYYTTAGSDVSIFRGYGRQDEMCTSFVSYYPNDVSIGMSAKLARCMALSGINLCWLQSGVTPQVEQDCNITAMRIGQTTNQVLTEMTASSCFNRTGCDPACRRYLNATMWPSNACYDPRRARQMAEVMAQGKFVADPSVAQKIVLALHGQRFCEQEIFAPAQDVSISFFPVYIMTTELSLIVLIVCLSLGTTVLLAALVAVIVKSYKAAAPYENIQ